MINIDITRALNNYEVTTKSTKNIKSTKADTENNKTVEVKDQKNFSEYLGEKVTEKEVTKNPIKENTPKEDREKVEALEVTTEKLEAIITKIEDGLDDEAMEMLAQLLEFLNIPGSSLQDCLKALVNIDTSNLNLDYNNVDLVVNKLFDGNSVNNTLLERSKNISTDNKENKNMLATKIIEILNLNADDTNLKLVENLENILNKIVPLLQQEGGKDLKISNIILAIKEKLDSVSNEDSSEGASKKEIVDYLRVNIKSIDSKQELTSDNKGGMNALNIKEVDDEMVLSKILEGDVKDFSGLLNKLQAKTSIANAVSQEGTPILKETFNSDVIKNIKFMVRNTVSELNVKIYPKELGEITIKILSEEGIMRAEIKATSKETYNILNSNMNEIKKSLSNENIRIHDVNIGLYSEDTTYFSGRNSKEGSDTNNKHKVSFINGVSEEDEAELEQNYNNSNLNLLA